MTDKILKYMNKYHMVAEGDTVIIGVSGGADSVCLLRVLLALREKVGFDIRAVHVEHGIRGEESKQDAAFVERLCSSLEVPLVQYGFEVPYLAKEQGVSEEEMGRMLRYEVFEKEAAKYPQSKIAVAHHRNDNAETMLHNLVRGSMIAGLGGIAPVRGKVIRPLLCVEREEIEIYLQGLEQEYRTDSTNADTSYTRNYIRREVIPQLQKVNSAAVWHMSQTAEMLRGMQEYLQEQIQSAVNTLVAEDKDGMLIDVRGLEEQYEFLRNGILYQALTAVAMSSKDIGSRHIEDLWELAHKQVGKQMNLPYGVIARRTYDGVWIGKISGEQHRVQERPLEKCKEFICHVFENQTKIQDFPKKKYTKWLDYGKIETSLCVRNRKPGDYFYLEENGGVKKLKQYFVDEKIPREQRDKIMLVADGSHIVWIVGYRISAYYKITEQTERIIEIQYEESQVW